MKSVVVKTNTGSVYHLYKQDHKVIVEQNFSSGSKSFLGVLMTNKIPKLKVGGRLNLSLTDGKYSFIEASCITQIMNS